MADEVFDVAILGGGLAGVTAACRLQASGYSTVVLEVHDKLGGCAGYYERGGFSFDIGATTLVDFDGNGIGSRFLTSIGLHDLQLEHLPGYEAWLPDRRVTLHRCPAAWDKARREAFGDTAALGSFWRMLDDLGQIFWVAAADGLKLPIKSPSDVFSALRKLPPSHWIKARHLLRSLGDHFDLHGVRGNAPLRGLMSMLCEDTLHARTIDDAPLINAALGTSIRTRISRPVGGFRAFWKALEDRYTALGGTIRLKTKVTKVQGQRGSLQVITKRGSLRAQAVINTIPAPNFVAMAPSAVSQKMRRYVERDAQHYGAGIVLCLGVPEEEVSDHEHRHHQLLQSYDAPLGDGNNMFISCSRHGDHLSAPPGHRSVMISTHTEIDRWQCYDRDQQEAAKQQITEKLLHYARRVYPNLGANAVILETGTPSAYERFGRRPLGAVGGVRTTMANSNQNAMPSSLGDGIHTAGDYTWPGLGSVACLMSGEIAVRRVKAELSSC